jgi:hypothetical protein
MPQEEWSEILAPHSYETLVQTGTLGLLLLPAVGADIERSIEQPSRPSPLVPWEPWSSSTPWFEGLRLNEWDSILYPNDNEPSAQLGLLALTPVAAQVGLVTPVWLDVDGQGRLRRARTEGPAPCKLHIAASGALTCRTMTCTATCVALFARDDAGDRVFLRCVCE